jgi:hypothetical protein
VPATSRRAREIQYRYIECSVSRIASDMRRILDFGFKGNYANALDKMGKRRGCAFTGYIDNGNRTISFLSDEATLRGMIAEAFVKKNGGAAGLAVKPLQAVYKREWHAITTRPAAVDEMATCVAETNPAGIVAVLRTGHGSPEEVAAIRTISPSLGTCLGVGAKLTANRTAIRSALAEALYHRSYDAPPSGAGASQ